MANDKGHLGLFNRKMFSLALCELKTTLRSYSKRYECCWFFFSTLDSDDVVTVFRSITRCVIDASRFEEASVSRTLLPSDDIVILEKPSFMDDIGSLFDELKVFDSYLVYPSKFLSFGCG